MLQKLNSGRYVLEGSTVGSIGNAKDCTKVRRDCGWFTPTGANSRGGDELSSSDILRTIKWNNACIIDAERQIKLQESRRNESIADNLQVPAYDIAQEEQWEVPCLFRVDEAVLPHQRHPRADGQSIRVEVVEERTG